MTLRLWSRGPVSGSWVQWLRAQWRNLGPCPERERENTRHGETQCSADEPHSKRQHGAGASRNCTEHWPQDARTRGAVSEHKYKHGKRTPYRHKHIHASIPFNQTNQSNTDGKLRGTQYRPNSNPNPKGKQTRIQTRHADTYTYRHTNADRITNTDIPHARIHINQSIETPNNARAKYPMLSSDTPDHSHPLPGDHRHRTYSYTHYI